MPETKTIADVVIERRFTAPPAEVYRQWTDLACLGDWFAPAGFETEACQADVRPGGDWRLSYRSAEGWSYEEQGTFVELRPVSRVVLTLQQIMGEPGPMTTVTVDLLADGDETVMSFRQSGWDTQARRDANADGWGGCFRKLANRLAVAELRQLHAAWFRASEAQDLDGQMEPVAEGIVSYEHQLPFVYEGKAAVRQSCRQGLESLADGEFRWDVPDLHVEVDGDLAVAWGLNRMAVNGEASWSRGTRIFRRIDGRWQLIHQHVSYPYDPETGTIVSDKG